LKIIGFRICVGGRVVKIGVLGGAGDMGFSIVTFLSEMKEVEEILIGDINPDRVKDVIKELGEAGRR